MNRAFGILFGGLSQLLFAFTVVHLFTFLQGANAPPDPAALWRDGWLSLQFAVFHSLLLHPRIRGWLVDRVIPAPFYGCCYCVATCATLLLTIFNWRSSPAIVWEFTGAAKTAVEAAFIATWGALTYSLHLNGLGWQTGLTPWWHWYRNQPTPRRVFAPRGVYRLMRHPGYLSFLGLVWFTPVMTLDRAVLTAVWTAYIMIGSWFKDQRLIFFLGDVYREYQAHVPGYPGMPVGPLARVPHVTDPAKPHSAPHKRAA